MLEIIRPNLNGEGLHVRSRDRLTRNIHILNLVEAVLDHQDTLLTPCRKGVYRATTPHSVQADTHLRLKAYTTPEVIFGTKLRQAIVGVAEPTTEGYFLIERQRVDSCDYAADPFINDIIGLYEQHLDGLASAAGNSGVAGL